MGAPTPLTIWAGRLAPGLVDRYLARTNIQAQQTDQPIPPDRPHYLWEPLPGDPGAHGDFDAEAKDAQPAAHAGDAPRRAGRRRRASRPVRPPSGPGGGAGARCWARFRGVWEALDLEVGGLRLHVTRTGGGGPPLVVLHGVTDDGLCWTALAEQLQGAYDVLMVDARGHGRSSAPDAGYGPSEQAADVAGALDALGLEGALVLGHSMGAGTALALAALYRHLPRAILLEDPPPWWVRQDVTPEDLARREERVAGVEAMKRKTHAQLLAEQRRDARTWTDAEIVRWAESKQRCSPQRRGRLPPGATATSAGPSSFRASPARSCCSPASPERGALVTTDDAAALRALVPQTEVAHIPGGGHSIRHDQPQAYLAAVRAFLERV